MGVEKKFVPYVYIAKPEIEQYANKEEWEDNTIEEVEEIVSNQTTLETPRMTKKN